MVYKSFSSQSIFSLFLPKYFSSQSILCLFLPKSFSSSHIKFCFSLRSLSSHNQFVLVSLPNHATLHANQCTVHTPKSSSGLGRCVPTKKDNKDFLAKPIINFKPSTITKTSENHLSNLLSNFFYLLLNSTCSFQHMFSSVVFYFKPNKKKSDNKSVYIQMEINKQKTRLVTPPMTSHFSNHKFRSLRFATLTIHAHCRLH